MANNIRKAVTARGVDMSVMARSESEIENFIDEIDVLMVGPHLAYIIDEIDDYVGEYPVKVVLMRPDYYSTLDGEKAVDHLLEAIGQSGARP